MIMKKPRKVFTVQDWCDLVNKDGRVHRVPYVVGQRIQTNREYTAGDDKDGPLHGVILGVYSGEMYQVSEHLEAKGFTEHQVYQVMWDNGQRTVVWPMEINLEGNFDAMYNYNTRDRYA
jgi:hypothetical protein